VTKEIKLIFDSCFGCRHCKDLHEKKGAGYEFNITFFCTYEQPGLRIPNNNVHTIQDWCKLPAKTTIDCTRKNDLQRGSKKSKTTVDAEDGYPWDCDCEACVREQRRQVNESTKDAVKKKQPRKRREKNK